MAGSRRSGNASDPNAPSKEMIEAWDEIETEELKPEMIPSRGILPMGHFFTEASPLSFFTCLWKHLKDKDVTPIASEDDWKMNFVIPDDIL